MKALFLIPARTGSKRLPNKNFKEFCRGFSLVDLAVQHAQRCALSCDLGLVVVSTDKGSLETGLQPNDAIVHLRPRNLAQDDTPMMPVIRDAVSYAVGQHFHPEFVVLLQPTSPLRTVSITKRCMALSLEKGTPVCTVAEIRHPIGASVHHYTGSCYVYPIHCLHQDDEIHPFFHYEVGQPEDIDVDTEIDWICAQELAKAGYLSK